MHQYALNRLAGLAAGLLISLVIRHNLYTLGRWQIRLGWIWRILLSLAIYVAAIVIGETVARAEPVPCAPPACVATGATGYLTPGSSAPEGTMSFGTHMVFELPLPDGLYTVTLTFWDPNAMFTGHRVFDVLVNDEIWLRSFDIFRRAGAQKVLKRSMVASVSDGVLRIELVSPCDKCKPAVLSGITVEPVLSTRI